jgi:hypothetical protein
MPSRQDPELNDERVKRDPVKQSTLQAKTVNWFVFINKVAQSSQRKEG